MTYVGKSEARDADRLLSDEQAALRRVATLVAAGATASELFAAVAAEVPRVLDVRTVVLARYGPGRTITVLASLNERGFTVGSRWPLDGPSVPAAVLDTTRPARIDDYSELPGTIAAGVRESELGPTVGVPITVDGTVWGVMTVAALESELLPAETDKRLSDFTDLVAIAISNAESRDGLRRVADEQVALRRVATLVAARATTAELCAAVVDEVVQVLDVPAAWLLRYEPDRSMTVLAAVNDPAFPPGSRWSLEGTSVTSMVFETGRVARIDDFSELYGPIAAQTRESGFLSSLGVPIIVDGAVWGAVCVGTTDQEPLPADTEARLSDFTKLVAIAISNAESRRSLHLLADEQASLRRVATLVAEGASPSEIFSAVAEEVARILEVTSVSVVRYEPDSSSVVVASLNDPGFPVGSRWPADGPSLNATVFATHRPARVDHSALPGPVAETARASGVQSGVGVPIIVDGSVWGMVAIGRRHRHEALPPDAEAHLAAFTDLIATAISNAESRDGLRRLADEQAALHRVASLVARAAPPAAIVGAVAEEIARVFALPAIEFVRYESNATATVIANSGGHLPIGSRWPLDGPSIMRSVFRTGRPARIDDFADLPGTIAESARGAGVRSAVGVPIVVDGATWGAIITISTTPEPIPEGLETRLHRFTDLVETAISNLQARDDLRGLAAEQAALSRVATLVAEGADSAVVSDAVCAETGRLLGAASVNLSHYTPDGVNVTVAGWSLRGTHIPNGTRFPLTPDTAGGAIVRTRAPARVDSWEGAPSELATMIRERGIRSSLGAPVMVEGQLWGALVAATDSEEPLPAGSELRLARFTELIATAISNRQARDDLRGLANEHAALRRVATLVAEGATADELFSAVATEVAQVLAVSGAQLDRYEPDGTAVMLASSHDPGWDDIDRVLNVGHRWSPEPGSLTAVVQETGQAARIDDYSEVPGSIGEVSRAAGIGSASAAPIIVDGKLWGAIRVFSRHGTSLAADIDVRLRGFTQLVATAVSNAAAQADLLASRARIVAAGDEARRRIERNLHDGTQQRLIALGLDLQRIRGMLEEDDVVARAGLDQLGEDLESVLADVRELSRGLHPPLLARGGLRASLRALARRSPIPVEIDVELRERPPAAIEAAVYYVVSEALTNAIKYSQATAVSVTVETDHAGAPFGIALDGRRGLVTLHATVSDNGIGGAELTAGSGLIGLVDRADALGGRLRLDSPRGGGTRISVVLPVGSPEH